MAETNLNCQVANTLAETNQDVVPYSPTISAVAFDPVQLIQRQIEAEMNEMESMLSVPLGTPIPGTGPEVTIGIDAEWVHDPITRTNRILSIQFHLVGECGEFSHIEYLEAAHG